MKFPLKRFALTFVMFTVITALCAVGSLAAEAKLAQVRASSLRFRAQPSLNGAEIGRIANGTTVLVVDTVENGEWYKVVHNFTTGYVSAQYAVIVGDADAQIGDGLSTGVNVNVRKSPSLSGTKITQLSKGQRVTVTGVSQGWYKVLVNGAQGYVHADYIEIVKPLARGAVASAPLAADGDDIEPDIFDGDGEADSSFVSEAAPETAGVTGIHAEIVAFAKQYLGCKYAYGGNGPKSFDCSGFTTFVFKHFGYKLNRSSAGQLQNGKAVDKKNLLPGDLVLFRDTKINTAAASHAGMYIGDGKFIHSSSRGSGVVISSLNDSYYSKTFVGARRVI